MAPSKYPNSLNISLFLFVLFFSLYLVKSDNQSVLNFFLELKYVILNISMESKIIKDKGTLFRCTLLTLSLLKEINSKHCKFWLREIFIHIQTYYYKQDLELLTYSLLWCVWITNESLSYKQNVSQSCTRILYLNDYDMTCTLVRIYLVFYIISLYYPEYFSLCTIHWQVLYPMGF
jgi:hypothetical protein